MEETISVILKSLLDLAASIVLLLVALTVKDYYMGWIECLLWNSEFLLWGLYGSSTWNIVILTVERFVDYRGFAKFQVPRLTSRLADWQ